MLQFQLNSLDVNIDNNISFFYCKFGNFCEMK